MNPKIPDNVILTSLDEAINWGKDNSPGSTFFGVSCCFAEIMTSPARQFDLDRFTAEVLSSSPCDANLMIIAGTPFKKMGATLLHLYEQMPNPKWVVAMGDCANSGGMYDVYSVIQGVNQLLPVDVYIPGCPPHPEAFIQGLMLLREKVANEDRGEGVTAPILVEDDSKGDDHFDPEHATAPLCDSSLQQPKVSFPNGAKTTAEQVLERFKGRVSVDPDSVDMPGFIATTTDLPDLLKYLKRGNRVKYARLEDITAIDERLRRIRPEYDFTLVYHLLSLQVPGYVRIKVPLTGVEPEAPSITSLWPSASWYEREIFDMFGIHFSGHPDLRRILLPPEWAGFPLRKDHVARATDMAPFTAATAHAMPRVPADGFFNGEKVETAVETVILNIGPHHPGTHGVLRLITRIQSEKIVDLDMDIGYQHRGVEKIGERQNWNRYLPYTNRIDYLSGVQNNLAYLHSVETMLGVELPPRAESIRIMLCELFRIANHLVWLGTFAHDIGVITLVSCAFTSREKIFAIVKMITGGRMHPAWFRIGGVPDDLPDGWQLVVESFTHDFNKQIDALEKLLIDSPVFRVGTEGIGAINSQTAVDWGFTGPNLRATGIAWDVRRAMPYSGYDRFDFDVVTADGGDCFARYRVRLGEMRESLKIVRQAAVTMPGGHWMSEDYRYASLQQQEGLIDSDSLPAQFTNINSGPTAPKGECYRAIESSKGECGYYAVSDGGSTPYRMRIRTPSFAHLQGIPKMTRDCQLADLIIILGSIDFLLADSDR